MSERIREVLKKITDEALHKEIDDIIDELRCELEVESTDLGVLRSKIAGVWPKEDGENYYERIDGELYEVHGIKVDENAKKEENRS